jgi:histidine triad (HIT) family protein
MTEQSCAFCRIVAGDSPASVIWQDEEVMAFMNLRAVNKGDCMVIPKEHIDHFTSVPDPLAAKIMLVAQRIGRRILELYKPERVGYVVHGYGVPHAHLLIVPQNDPNDITSRRFIRVVDGEIQFSEQYLAVISREELDRMAAALAIGDPPMLLYAGTISGRMSLRDAEA